ncbi:hypothetical protein EG835_02785 [bacterium]|nr:hypothetical protein [bacterium]
MRRDVRHTCRNHPRIATVRLPLHSRWSRTPALGGPPPTHSVKRDFNLDFGVHMTRPLVRKRLSAAARQDYRCYYCGLPMWDSDPARFLRTFRVPKGLLAQLRCTAEHLHARSAGGTDRSDNLVAACAYCNSHRHRALRPLPPEQFRAYVRRRMAKGRWLAARIPSDIQPGFHRGA